ncbi:MAG: LapA family protein [Pseudomonadales bacterium]|nr:LapA family protein [Pseudomonadales bacterium]
MGILKLFSFVLAITIMGVIGGFFMVKNGMEIPVHILVSASPIHLTVGQLSALSLIVGVGVGLLFCAAFMFIQFLELQAARRKVANYEKQFNSLGSGSYKDMP